MFQGTLFTRDWLTEGICATDQWRSLSDAEVGEKWEEARSLLERLLTRRNPTEAETEAELIWPVLTLLGWDHVSVQPNMTVRGRKDVPDALLFIDADADMRARGLEQWQRFRHGAALVEAKRWNRPLDRKDQGEEGVPSTQVMHYLRRADAITQGKMRWGMLTNGRQWRLYYQGALSIAEDFLEIDLGKIFELPNCPADLFDTPVQPNHAFRLFLLLFGRSAFAISEQGLTFHLRALEAGRQWEERVRKDLADTVFDRVFPRLIEAIPSADPQRPAIIDQQYAEDVRSAALFLLYRLLFVLYAEDRNLLPDENGPYAAYCLTRLRREIEEAHVAGLRPAGRSQAYWSRLETIFGAIGEGDDSLGIPPYNGGLFDPASSTVLSRIRLGDDVLGDIILALSHRSDGTQLRYINYRDLSVQQLGSIYESILEYGVEASAEGVRPRADNSARHRSGSYYTPEPLVSLIIDKTVGPIAAEKTAAFARAVEEGRLDLESLDPATALLDVRVVDPAMGSGHFLVSLVDWLSDKVLTAIGEAEALAGDGYSSPLVGRLASLRRGIIDNARRHGWPIVEEQLDDRHIVRRMVLKRCVYGVDLNPMAVELAKVALWLHSFTVGAPLSFLNHHLRHGNSVLGAWVRPTMLWLSNRGSLMPNRHIAQLDNVARQMEAIEALTDSDLTEVGQSKALFATVEEASAPLDALLSMIKADELMGVLEGTIRRPRETSAQIEADGRRRLGAMPEETEAQRERKEAEGQRLNRAIERARTAERRFERAEALKMVHEGSFGDPSQIAMGQVEIAPSELRAELSLEQPIPVQDSLLPNVRPDDRRRLLAQDIVSGALSIARDNHFLNWEVVFPGVWSGLSSAGRTGGFDAVIGNPPYVRGEELGAIKPALRKNYRTYAGSADLYVYFYEQALKLLRPGGRLGYVVTNKWLRAGYATELRRMFSEDAWVEFLADFGHSRHFFPDADVFPCVITVRKPNESDPPAHFDLAVISRDDVPREGLAEAVTAAIYQSERGELSEGTWVLEPPDVAALLRKIRERGVALSDYAGVRPLYGLKTGFNDAFQIDAETRARLIAEDPSCADVLKAYLRGQDIERWLPKWAGLWMVLLKSSSDHPWPWAGAPTEAEAERIFSETYPALHRHLKQFESITVDGEKRGLRHRQDRGRYWWELRPCAYYDLFSQPRIFYNDITWTSSFCVDDVERYTNNSAYFLPTGGAEIAAALNAPVGWWYAWRKAQHGKDDALRYFTSFLENYPIPDFRPEASRQLAEHVGQSRNATASIRQADSDIADWLRIEFNTRRPLGALTEASALTYDAFVDQLRATLPRRQPITPTQLRVLHEAFVETVEPARAARITLLQTERAIATLVEQGYGLSDEEVALMWQSAPPRMPLAPPPGFTLPLT